MVGSRLCASACVAGAVWLASQAQASNVCSSPGPLDAPVDAPPALDLALIPPDTSASDAELAAQFRPRIDFTSTSRIPPDAAAILSSALPAGPDLSAVRAAAAAYRRGDRAGAEIIVRQVRDPVQRTALDWIALKYAPQPDYARLAEFGAAHPGWPSNDWVRYEQEAALFAAPPPGHLIEALFANDPPRTPPGKLALARAAKESGHSEQAGALVRFIWQNDVLNLWTEGLVLREFAGFLTRADHKLRSDRLFYSENYAAAARAAAVAGPDVLALLNARIVAMRAAPRAQVAPEPATEPGVLYARVRALRRADRTLEAAALLEHAPRDPSQFIDGDRWWSEQRLIARRLLDTGFAKAAYSLCQSSLATSPAARTDAEFLAGWIALRFLDQADDSARHFANAAQFATTPQSISRAAYWQGRAAQALDQREVARRFYQRAAQYQNAYYGQLAAQKLDLPPTNLRAPLASAAGDARDEATQVIALLYDAQLDELALSLALDEARKASDEAQLAALAKVVIEHGDALASVEVGKRAIERGFALDEAAFPTFGVPHFTPVANSADLAEVYSVARQESEFVGRAASGAGARGLMQLLPSTARETARRVGLPFDNARLTGDPAFNAQIGAAFLGQLMSDEGGSAILAFAAYNAGPARVQQWIKAYGDPRTGAADPVDWVERIPFDETRDYVQRVSENLGVYRTRIGASAVALIDERPGRLAQAGP
jgi:soluble lytic murein transglycosylase